jgi:hypothetical protein
MLAGDFAGEENASGSTRTERDSRFLSLGVLRTAASIMLRVSSI